MKRILSILLLAAGLAHGQTVTSVSASSNGTLLKPVNLWTANAIPTLTANNTFSGNNTFGQLNSANQTVTGNLTVQGSTTLGDATGDTLAISGPITAAGATSTGANNIAKVGALDGRYGVSYKRGSVASTIYNNTASLANVSGSEISDIPAGLYYVRLFTRWFNSDATAGIKQQLTVTGAAVNPRGLRIIGGASSAGVANVAGEISVATGATSYHHILEGWLNFTTSGTVVLQASQNVATVADTSLTGYVLILERIE
jgi:hypothetical protein